jgi:aminoglycoside phosphotransferase (APT) family kinase protein
VLVDHDGMRWLDGYGVDEVRAAIREVAPELAGCRIEPRNVPVQDDPEWASASAVLDGAYVVKYAWGEPAARRLAHEIAMIAALSGASVPYLPEVVAAGTDPVLLVTWRVPASSLFQVVDRIDRDAAGAQLAEFLVALHRPDTLARVEASVGALPAPRPATATDEIRGRFGRWARPEQRATVDRWCDWADEVLAEPVPHVLVHGDLHGDNQVWQRDRLRLVIDFESAGPAAPEFELRAFPGTGPGSELMTATLWHYAAAGGTVLSVERVMAWHLRNSLGDALWRSEAGFPLPDHRTPPEWVDDLAARMADLGLAL